MRKVLAAITLMFCFNTSLSADEFVFTAIPDQDESALKERFNKIAVYLGKQLKIKVKYIPVKSYAAAVLHFEQPSNSHGLAVFPALEHDSLSKDPAQLRKGLKTHFLKPIL